jgi:hypothetical protein
VELGFRPRDATADEMSDQLADYLTRRHIQAPVTSADDTKAVLPSLSVLERMIQIVGDCPEPRKDPK